MTGPDELTTFTPFSTCEHGILRIMEAHVLGVTVGCANCNETFDLEAEAVEENYYHFKHHSHKGADNDMEILVHYKIIE